MKAKLTINNKLRGKYADMNPDNNHIRINVRAHKKKGKLDKAELASTIKHELMHVKHPKMTEKQVYKRTAKTKIPYGEQQKLLAKLRHTKLNRKIGATKRKLKMKRSENAPGALITKANSQKLSQKDLAIRGLI